MDSLPGPRPGLGAVVSGERDKSDQLLDVLEFRSQGKQLCFGHKFAFAK